MKLMMCGKGGCGKSTISAMLAKEFAKLRKNVLVIDTDESNFGLHRQLGVELPPDFINLFGGKEAVLGKLMASDDVENIVKPMKLSDIPAEYSSDKGGIRFIASGKIQEAGEGCACPFGAVIQQFVARLELGDDDIVIADTEAGIEHFGRGVDYCVDAILMVVDPSYESMMLANKVEEICTSIEKPVYYILNRTDEINEPIMREKIKTSDHIAASIPNDRQIYTAGLKGEELSVENEPVCKLAQFLLANV